MKKLYSILMLLLMGAMLILPCAAAADGEAAITVPTEPFSWEYLATVAGAAAFTLLAAQYLKLPLDMVWKIPTRIFVYCIAAVVLLVATAFSSGLNAHTVLLAFAYAFIAAFAAMGAYEVTFAKSEKK